MRVFVTGGTGLIGSKLIAQLRGRGDEVVLLTRRPAAVRDRFTGSTVVEGDPTQPGAWQDQAAGCDAVVHLAGENLFAKRWNDAFKKQILDSRVLATNNVVQALGRQPKTAAGAAKVLVSASAVGIYGPHGDEEVDEETPRGHDYLASVCAAWEDAARAAEPLGVRTALLRIGVVLDKDEGALAKQLLPFKLGMGGPVGSGRQWLPWIHHADIVGLLLFSLDNSAVAGPINGTAPTPVTNKEFGKALGRALGRPAIAPLPGFMLRLMVGEVAAVILEGQRVLPRKAQRLGYPFRFPTLDAALADILK